MRLAVIGGRLQGLEAVYLAKKAGFEVLLVDREEHIPAKKLADSFHLLDAANFNLLAPVLENVDLVIPALENSRVLKSLTETCQKLGLPLAFDEQAYHISSSKIRSDNFLKNIGVPLPCYYPACAFPVIAKPSESSGSVGVSLFTREQDLARFMKDLKDDRETWVIQEYLPGPSYSLEVLGDGEVCRILQVTDLEMDAGYDCKRVTAPTRLTALRQKEFGALGQKIATALPLKGIMDIEVICAGDALKVLEIDARLPSQTPICVYHSSGVNMVALLADLYLCHVLPAEEEAEKEVWHVILEHIEFRKGCLEVKGEHIISSAGPLQLIKNGFGADEVLTDYQTGKEEWVATLIVKEKSRASLWQRRNKIIDNICQEFKVKEYLDLVPKETYNG